MTYHTGVTDADFFAIDNKGAYATVDFNILVKQPWRLPIEVELSAFNLFNKQTYNPTYAPDSYYDVTREPRFLSLSVRLFI